MNKNEKITLESTKNTLKGLSKDNNIPNLDVSIEAPTAIKETPWEWGWWKNPTNKKILDAETFILETLEDPAHINFNGWIQIEHLLKLLDSIFGFEKHQANVIIGSLMKEGIIIEPKKGYIALDLDYVK